VRESLLVSRTIALASILSSVSSANSQPICGIEFISPEQVEKVLTQEMKLPRGQGNSLYVSYFDKKKLIMWTFATLKNPAHPAVVCRKTTLNKGEWVLTQDVRCGGSKQDCDSLAADFDKLNKQMIETMKSERARSQ
jgi:hypothetical protein